MSAALFGMVQGCVVRQEDLSGGPQALKTEKFKRLAQKMEALKQALPKARGGQSLGQLKEQLSAAAQGAKTFAEEQFREPSFLELEPLFEQPRSINMPYFGLGDRGAMPYEGMKTGKHPDLAAAMEDLQDATEITRAGSDLDRLEQLHQKALEKREKLVGVDHPELPPLLRNLARIYQRRGDYEDAEALYQRARAIVERALGPTHPNFATALDDLAGLYRARGDYTRAEPLYRQALAIREQALGPEAPATAAALNNLGVIEDLRGDYARAIAHYERAQAIYERFLETPGRINIGREQEFAITLANAGIASWKRGNLAAAVRLLADAHEIHEKTLWLMFPGLTEEKQQELVINLTRDTDALISFHQRSAREDQQAARLALTTILQRKSRGLEAMTEAMTGLHGRIAQGDDAPIAAYETEGDRELRDRLRAVQEQIAGQFYLQSESEDAKEIARLQREEQILKAKIGTRTKAGQSSEKAAQIQQMIDQYKADRGVSSAEEWKRQPKEVKEALQQRIRTETAEAVKRGLHQGGLPRVLDEVQHAIPEGSALIEMAVYRPLNPKAEHTDARWGKERYAAYILRSQGPPASVDLGEVEVIDQAVVSFRQALSYPGRMAVTQIARELDERIMRPLRPFLGKTQIVLIAPEGLLNLVPFGALVDEREQYLVERFLFTYLTTGRDLLRFQVSPKAQGRAVIIADPEFGAAGEYPQRRFTDNIANAQTPDRSLLASLVFDRLPGTAAEAQAIQGILADAELLTGGAATESALKERTRPRILHLATHGFFLPDADLREPSQPMAERGSHWNPLLRSGLVFAGVNQGQSGRDDGVLTALEATSLDLRGTGLVVLSACETGIGDTKNGEGVFGLRRALVMAGAESQLVSLWNVDDAATKVLMVDYYRRLFSGEGRSEALRQTQLQMLKDNKWKHPFYWAGFILSGQWTGLDADPRQ